VDFMSRKIDYLFLRNGSRNWHIKLQNANGERIEKSLGTSDRAQAEILALPALLTAALDTQEAALNDKT
jgi:hypothetical protein